VGSFDELERIFKEAVVTKLSLHLAGGPEEEPES
jgi:hypothetical protein